MTTSLTLGFDATFEGLHEREGLAALDAQFVGYLGARDETLRARLAAARSTPDFPRGEEPS